MTYPYVWRGPCGSGGSTVLTGDIVSIFGWQNMKLRPSSGHPSWHRVLIPASDVAKLGAGGLMDNFEKACRAACVSQGVRVYHNEIDGAHIFFFCPKASAVAAHVLEQFGARRCIGEPDVSGCRQVKA